MHAKSGSILTSNFFQGKKRKKEKNLLILGPFLFPKEILRKNQIQSSKFHHVI
jgi:hypothetical protein